MYAFSRQAWWLRLNGFDFRPVVMPGPRWSTYLDDLPNGFVVAVASPASLGSESTDDARGLAAQVDEAWLQRRAVRRFGTSLELLQLCRVPDPVVVAWPDGDGVEDTNPTPEPADDADDDA